MFREIIEKISNPVLIRDKTKYVQQVWNLLQKSYASIGGIQGSGFSSPEEMIQNIKMWKLYKKDQIVKAGILYKDKNNQRKSVAVFTDGSEEGKKHLLEMLKADFTRSNIEVSHDLLRFIEKKMPIMMNKYVIPAEEVSKILNKEINIISKYKYERIINNKVVIKMMLGTQKKIK